MTYPVALLKSDEGYSVSCPALPGCCSQGATEEEALDNIRSAIEEYLAVQQEQAPRHLRPSRRDDSKRNLSAQLD
ncbi:MAG TPA: type II toxin-antitoxin system HicB family antitoxin [Bryobacteraceae bacterium]|jgi:predicted RNase H-like HicB family nuclease